MTKSKYSMVLLLDALAAACYNAPDERGIGT